MRNIKWMAVLAAAGMWIGSPSAPAADAAKEALFRSAMAELDPGGDVLAYMNMDGLFRGGMNSLAEFIRAVGGQEPDTAKVLAIIEKVHAFLDYAGLYDFNAMGMSSVPLGDGLHDVKIFMGRTPKTPAPPLWSIYGGAPHAPTALTWIPDDAAIGGAFDLDLQMLWDLMLKGVGDLGGDAALQKVTGTLDGLKTDPGVDMTRTIQSLGGQMIFAVTLSRTETITLPLGARPYAMPKPGLLVGLAVKDETLLQTLQKMLRESGAEVDQVEMEGATVFTPPNAPAEEPFVPAFCQQDGYLLFASNPQILKAALVAHKDGKGLPTNPGYQKLAGRVPSEVNGIEYVDERYMQVMMDIGLRDLANDPNAAAIKPFVEKIMKLVYGQGPMISVWVNKPHGMVSQTISAISGRQMAAYMAVMPVAVVAGIAMPAIVGAKEKAQDAQAMNALRMVDAAKEMWAMDGNRPEGTDVTEEDLAPFLMGGALPPVINGGRIQINPVGEPPVIVMPNGRILELP